jgi:hypothetical protein
VKCQTCRHFQKALMLSLSVLHSQAGFGRITFERYHRKAVAARYILVVPTHMLLSIFHGCGGR